MKIDLDKLTIETAHEHLQKKDFSARELSEAYLSEIEKKNPKIHAYLEVYQDVLDQADEADKLLKKGGKNFLTGIPLAIKDNILIKGRRAGSASKILEGYHATYDATVIGKLKAAGAVFLGRTNMDEFAMGSSTENSAYGPSKNPIDPSRVPGGSSGGSAAAVAMNGALSALGSDTGGSIRQPAAYCGVVGFKPTYGAVSRYGLMAMGSSLDQIGPITKTVRDAEILHEAIKGRDPKDSTTISDETYSRATWPKKMVIGVPYGFTEAKGVDKSVIENFQSSLEKLKSLGFEIRPIELPNVAKSLAVYYILMPAEVSSNLARFDGVKFGALEEGDTLLDDYRLTRGRLFGKEVRRRIILGTYVLSAGYYDAYYGRANAVRALIRKEFDQVFASGVHVIATPTTPSPAFKFGEKAGDPVQMYLADIFTVPANITGAPCISVPSGFSEEGGVKLPLGIEFTAPHGQENILFEIGKKFESLKK